MKTSTHSTHWIADVETGNDVEGRSSVTHNSLDDGRASSAMRRIEEEDISLMTPSSEIKELKKHLETIVSVVMVLCALVNDEHLINFVFLMNLNLYA